MGQRIHSGFDDGRDREGDSGKSYGDDGTSDVVSGERDGDSGKWFGDSGTQEGDSGKRDGNSGKRGRDSGNWGSDGEEARDRGRSRPNSEPNRRVKFTAQAIASDAASRERRTTARRG